MSATPQSSPARRTLVLGGARSGKSAHAESLVAGGPVRYIATAIPDPSDADFAERIAKHRERRPADWLTVENADAATVLADPYPGATLIDDIGTWLTARLDARSAWEQPRGTVSPDTDALVAAVAAYRDRLVIVSPEVGMGVIPATRSGRLFRDEIGTLNQRLAQVCDEAVLIVAGLPLRLG
ncbi:bifunctional adenosylcobinamide kinase/adenosylcobinamide-phosphate guanylyltransferase [Nocardia cyriacigeorgica]|uniref:bifunctional adenosylcobinamide kinase/adenosylcobinamide-phosphate guanylyltransferase n=1 Tax=Nocardia cyriacigeorgica TaxID=135487 RepID=UPI0013D003BB|nr:bifunctional adenosylcobinamide kinase/adenosylcobinamide-phosphate guanylyltransferase [Nocardia cyriacigeorgica]NEW29941.1 bifunctional adenosylcobinamide kinase/adenosylcobinamide-phosphate guanylyltransferase [Nocardia cyriacigeorgica]